MSVVFVVESCEVACGFELLMSGNSYFSILLPAPANEVRVLLPNWITVQALKLYLKCMEWEGTAGVNIKNCQRLLWTADFFKDQRLLEQLVADVVLPNLTKDYIPLYLRDAYFRTQSESCFKVWEKLLAETSSLASKHAHLVIKKNFELLKAVGRQR